jgi:ABC-type lipoprotein export system ATPase subunit
MIEAKHIVKEFASNGKRTRILNDLDFHVQRGDFLALVGRSGTGKTTLLNLLGGLDKPTSGEILFDNYHLEAMDDAQLSSFRNKSVGFVFQTFFLRPMRTALDNIIIPLLFDKVPLNEARSRGIHALGEVGLSNFVHTRTRSLSGGQRQRVAIARAIINTPDLLLADEPTGNLDTQTSLEIFKLLRDYNQRHHTTIIVVTHDPLVEEFQIPMYTLLDGRIVRHSGGI